MSYWLQERQTPQRNRALSPQTIAEAALALLNSEGDDQLSVRTLAQRLEVVPSSLYRHVRNRDDILDLTLDAALVSDQQVAEAITSEDLVGLLLVWRSHLLRHPWAITHVMRRPPLGPGYLALSDRLCALLYERGVPDEELLNTSYAMSDFVLGCVLAQRHAETTRHQWPTSLVNDNHPYLHHAVSAHQPSWQAVIRRGLERLAGNCPQCHHSTRDAASH
ncbi:TetR family transcriptional regulator [Allosaccharopolyspora coralli]|uniref:TetR family transcriptional regulator n=1 Tax=Allosaccharopolyspora coralli TaxID=2665642 RepID=A0A5Q3Q608_9PSEU|nr:TetR/AcrR family transcriptional regulator C-terminal domain-containing protein [Allosaccharopolyspora coralli]QGK70028.1 TetR family transcriptional regulator [Allosaccharopolyspora coralli]